MEVPNGKAGCCAAVGRLLREAVAVRSRRLTGRRGTQSARSGEISSLGCRNYRGDVTRVVWEGGSWSVGGSGTSRRSGSSLGGSWGKGS